MNRAMLDALQTTEWGMTHFSGIVTNRQLPLRVMRQCVTAGLCHSIGRHPMADDEGNGPERFRETYVLTEAGFDALEAHYKGIGDHYAVKKLRELRDAKLSNA